MKLLVSKIDNSIVFVSNVADSVDNGIDVGGLIFPSQGVNVFDVESIPEGVTTQKFCYTVADGFTFNPEYNTPENDEVEQLKQDRDNLLLAVADLYEQLIALGGK